MALGPAVDEVQGPGHGPAGHGASWTWGQLDTGPAGHAAAHRLGLFTSQLPLRRDRQKERKVFAHGH